MSLYQHARHTPGQAVGGRKAGLGDILAFLLAAYACWFFIGLSTYAPGDLPSWVPFSYIEPPNSPPLTVGGTLGAVIVGSHLFLFGAGTALLIALIGVFTLVRLLVPTWRFLPRLPWIFLLLLSGIILLELQTFALQDVPERYKIEGVGGWLGHHLAASSRSLIGLEPTLILCGVIYTVSLFCAIGIHPVRFWRSCVALVQGSAERWVAFRMRKADPIDRLEFENRRLEKEKQRLVEEAVARGADPDELEFLANVTDSARPIPPPSPSTKSVKRTAPKPPVAPAARYALPPEEILDEPEPEEMRRIPPEDIQRIRATLLATMAEFGIECSPGEVTCGPSITRFEFFPATGVRVDRIAALERDLARATSAERINILAPIPGKNTVGIEIANSRKARIGLRELIQDPAWNDPKLGIPLALGKDIYGRTVMPDLVRMPHLLIGGTTGSGKSVCINSILASLLLRFSPDELRLLLVDPKVVEFQFYNDLPHLLAPVVTDTKKVIVALRVIIEEMQARYELFKEFGVRNLAGYNAKAKKGLPPKARLPVHKRIPSARGQMDDQLSLPLEEPEDDVPHEPPPTQLPHIVVIIDELADLMQTAQADVETAISRITAMARAAGIHLIVATQTPRVDVITGVIKSNIPSRLAFQVATKIDSRVILDQGGAERLLGQGDMLFLPPGTSKLIRAQGAFVTEEELQRLITHITAQRPPNYEARMEERLANATTTATAGDSGDDEDEELVQRCIEMVQSEGKASTSLLQRRLRLGYARAARIMDLLEMRGVVGPADGARPRKVLGDQGGSLANHESDESD